MAEATEAAKVQPATRERGLDREGASVSPARVGDIEIAWGERGKGEPLLLISGFGTTKEIWEENTVEKLATRFRVIAFDNRGMGGTSIGEKVFSIPQFAEDARGLLRSLGIEKCHVLGWSMGSFVAQEMALAYPECVDRLVLYASYADWSYPPSPEVLERLGDPSGTPEERGMRWIETLFPASWLESNMKRVGDIFSRPLGNIPAESLSRQQEAIETWGGTAGRLFALKASTLLLCGKEDILVPPENSLKMAELLPDASVKIVPSAGHGLMFQDPDTFTLLVLRFLERIKP